MNAKITSFILMVSTTVAMAAEPPPVDNENILIFTGEVRNFIELSEEIRHLSLAPTDPSKDLELQSLLTELQTTASRVADVYFAEAEDANREQFTAFLGATLAKHEDLKNYFTFIGNAFASEAQLILQKRREKNKKIFIYSTIGGVVLGLGGGALVLKYQGASKNYVTAGIVAIGLAAAASGGGYAARYYLPVSQDIKNALDFLERFPHGEDFTKELESQSMDLALGFDDIEEGSR